jgi:hypothetical protein
VRLQGELKLRKQLVEKRVSNCCTLFFGEPLINSESFSCVGKMPGRRTVQIKTPIAGNSQSKAGPMSAASVLGLAKIGNAAMRRSELAHFNKQMLIHELIRGSLGNN